MTGFANVNDATRKVMRANRGKDTKPEMVVRRLAHAMGYRCRLHRRDLPGRPDMVFPSRKKVVFVHGCFWHRHENCSRSTLPVTRRPYWSAKFARNVERDAANVAALEAAGWSVAVIWECEAMRDPSRTAEQLKAFLR